MEKKIPLVIVAGATASGKTSLGTQLAKKYNGEVISCDSMQIYKNLDIGTAKPTREEMGDVRHHMIDIVPATEAFSVERYCAVPAEILRVAHHGSPQSTGEAFLEAVKPAAAIVSCNAMNEKTHSRLAQAGTMVYDTDKHGALTVTVGEKGYSLQGYIR